MGTCTIVGRMSRSETESDGCCSWSYGLILEQMRENVLKRSQQESGYKPQEAYIPYRRKVMDVVADLVVWSLSKREKLFSSVHNKNQVMTTRGLHTLWQRDMPMWHILAWQRAMPLWQRAIPSMEAHTRMAHAHMTKGCHGAGRRLDIDPISGGRDLICILMSPSRD